MQSLRRATVVEPASEVCGPRPSAWFRHLVPRRCNPTSAAVFSVTSEPFRMNLRTIGKLLWPVWSMIARSETPAAAAAVARPARRLCDALPEFP